MPLSIRPIYYIFLGLSFYNPLAPHRYLRAGISHETPKRSLTAVSKQYLLSRGSLRRSIKPVIDTRLYITEKTWCRLIDLTGKYFLTLSISPQRTLVYCNVSTIAWLSHHPLSYKKNNNKKILTSRINAKKDAERVNATRSNSIKHQRSRRVWRFNVCTCHYLDRLNYNTRFTQSKDCATYWYPRGMYICGSRELGFKLLNRHHSWELSTAKRAPSDIAPSVNYRENSYTRNESATDNCTTREKRERFSILSIPIIFCDIQRHL